MNFIKLSDEWTKPRVAVLDDSPNEVDVLIGHLRTSNFEVSHFQTAQEFINAVRDKVFPIQLIDASLSKPVMNADGFRVARECAKIHPEALRICISAILSDLSVKQIIDALNPRYDPDLAMSLPASLGVRDIWGIYDKTTQSENLRDIVEDFRATIACGDETEIWVDEALAADFLDAFQGISWDEPGVLIEPQVQVVEIVRQLARRPGMPPIRKVTLEKLEKGRSKTVVAHMRIEFQRPTDKRLEKAAPKGRQSIIKIGRFRSIRQEIMNYTQVVPYILGATFYPAIEASGICRKLAGISYSCLDDGEQDVAPTLLDALYRKVQRMNENDAFASLARATEFKHGQIVSRASATLKGDHLLNAYTQRFPELQRRPASTGVSSPAAKPLLSDTLREANKTLQEHNAVVVRGSGETFLKLSSHQVPTAQSVEQLTQPFALWEDYWVGLEHGDLHLDNILLVRQGSAWSNFYIDFADAGQHHAMLDFVVMEVAVRFQSLKYLPSYFDAKNEGALLRVLCSLEDALLTPGTNDWTPQEALPDDLLKWTLKTWKIAHEIQQQANAYLTGGLKGSISKALPPDELGKQVEDEVECERQRFLCGVGLAGLAAMHLPQAANVKRLHQAWFGYVGQVYLTLFNQWKGRRM